MELDNRNDAEIALKNFLTGPHEVARIVDGKRTSVILTGGSGRIYDDCNRR